MHVLDYVAWNMGRLELGIQTMSLETYEALDVGILIMPLEMYETFDIGFQNVSLGE